MDFDQQTLDELVATAEAHSRRLAAITAAAIDKSNQLRQAMAGGNYDRVKQLLSDDAQSNADAENGGSVGVDENGRDLSGSAEQPDGGRTNSPVVGT